MSDHCVCVVEERDEAGGCLVLDLRGGAGRCGAHADPPRLPASLTEQVRPGGRLELAVRTGDLTPELWEDLLVEAGFTVEEILPLGGGAPGGPVDGRLIRARRRATLPRPRVTSRPRGARPPAAHATIGVGVIVRDGAGRILLGLHHGGTWELPGGKIEPGESVGAAAVRELLEETGLRASEQDVTVFAMLHDTVTGLTRVTMAAVLTVYEGVPVAAEPELVGEWHWTGTDELPSPLFVPSAQILTAWRPDLDIDHPPAHLLGIAGPYGRGAAPA
ncbi:NUDIX domain-containing protein [Streptomyces sp. NPDC006923]|uniref:nucleotide triphosphate diphosphatase NUDT15 n=1 Tax=Streptomyces sp. NPDC006923 TaxID=3155355 RepID=UPI0033CCC2DF